MARCYGCNSAVANYRRYVNTGHSFSTYYGKRVSNSTRSYYSNKFFCHDCAKEIDDGRRKSTVFVLFLISVGLTYYLLTTRF